MHNNGTLFDFSFRQVYLTRKALARFDKVANIETTRAVIEAAINNMCKANQRAAVRQRGEAFQFSENM